MNGRTFVASVLALATCGCAVESTSPNASASTSESLEPARSVAETSGPTPVPEGWTTVDIGGFDVRGIAEGEGRIVAVGRTRGGSGPWIVTSVDGESWTPSDFPGAGDAAIGGVEAIVHGKGGFVATGGRSNLATGISEGFVVHSADGLRWEEVEASGPSGGGSTILAGEWGYVIVTGTYNGDDVVDARPTRILVSPDGKQWNLMTNFTEFSEEHHWPGTAATNGSLIVALQGEVRLDDDVFRWKSDDGGTTWTRIVDPDLRLYEITFAGDRWFARGTERLSPVFCTSLDGEQWTCSAEDLPPMPVVATPTGYVSLSFRPREGLNAGTDSVQATSLDGVSWHIGLVGPPHNHIHGIAATSRGVFAWGGTDPGQDPTGNSAPFLLVHLTAIP